MSYHQWLSSTSTGQHVSASAKTQTIQLLDRLSHYKNCHQPIHAIKSHPHPVLTSQLSQKSHQATMAAAKEKLSNADCDYVGQVPTSEQPATLYYQTLQLLRTQHQSMAEMFDSIMKDSIANESKDYLVMPRAIGTQWNENMPQSISPSLKSSRDAKRLRPPPSRSLAATHPANYGQQASNVKSMPPPLLTPKQQINQTTPTSTKTHQADSLGLFSLPAELPWRSYTDPMWQTSSDPQYWSNNRTTLKSDSNTDHGNVVSPTWMIGLPFGSMTEMAESYPCDERQKLVGTERG